MLAPTSLLSGRIAPQSRNALPGMADERALNLRIGRPLSSMGGEKSRGASRHRIVSPPTRVDRAARLEWSNLTTSMKAPRANRRREPRPWHSEKMADCGANDIPKAVPGPLNPIQEETISRRDGCINIRSRLPIPPRKLESGANGSPKRVVPAPLPKNLGGQERFPLASSPPQGA